MSKDFKEKFRKEFTEQLLEQLAHIDSMISASRTFEKKEELRAQYRKVAEALERFKEKDEN